MCREILLYRYWVVMCSVMIWAGSRECARLLRPPHSCGEGVTGESSPLTLYLNEQRRKAREHPYVFREEVPCSAKQSAWRRT